MFLAQPLLLKLHMNTQKQTVAELSQSNLDAALCQISLPLLLKISNRNPAWALSLAANILAKDDPIFLAIKAKNSARDKNISSACTQPKAKAASLAAALPNLLGSRLQTRNATLRRELTPASSYRRQLRSEKSAPFVSYARNVSSN